MSAKRLWLGCVFLLLAASGVWTSLGKAAPLTELKVLMAAPVPKTSPWGRSLDAAVTRIHDRTSAEGEPLTLQVYYDQPESLLVANMRAGKWDMALVPDAQLGDIKFAAGMLRIPGVVSSWAAMDKVRKALRPKLEASFRQQGFELLGLIDRGRALLTTTGTAIGGPGQLQKAGKMAMPQSDFIAWQTVSALNPAVDFVSTSSEVQAGLNSQTIKSLFTSLVFAEQKSWTPYLSYALDGITLWYESAGVVSLGSSWNKLSDGQQEIVSEELAAFETDINAKIRTADADAMTRFKNRGTVHAATSTERTQWQAVFKDAWPRIRAYDASAYDTVIIALSNLF